MKIVIATPGFLPNIGGVSTNVSILAKGFTDAGHDVTVACLSPGPTAGYGYTVVRKPKFWTLFRLYRKADILILSNLAIRLIYPLLFLKRPYALRHHSETAFHLSSSPLSRDVLRKAVLPKATHFMTSAFIGRKSGFKDYSITHPFANPEHITADIRMPANLRRNAIFVGRLEPEKGILYLLDRWGMIRETLGIDKLRIIGNGSLVSEVERRIADGEVQHVEYVGHVQRAETAREMGRAIFSLVPSLWEEPFGAVALESLAAGTIVIHSDRGGLPETTSGLGFSFDPDSENSFREALQLALEFRNQLLASPEAEVRYQQNIEAHTAKFNPTAVVDRIISRMGRR